jgi:orotate phosphoribosyltransferase
MDIPSKIAQALLKIHAVIYSPDKPIKFRTGILSPLYLDNRVIASHPQTWQLVVNTFCDLIKEKNLQFDMVGGLETSGLLFSTVVGYVLHKPTIFVRKSERTYGTQKRIEGGNVKGKTILLVQDMVTTGKSILETAQILRFAQAKVTDCLIIDSHDFVETEVAFAKAKINMYVLTTYPVIIREALKLKYFTKEDIKIIEDWYDNPWGWGK